MELQLIVLVGLIKLKKRQITLSCVILNLENFTPINSNTNVTNVYVIINQSDTQEYFINKIQFIGFVFNYF